MVLRLISGTVSALTVCLNGVHREKFYLLKYTTDPSGQKRGGYIAFVKNTCFMCRRFT
jgi:hypothetical protein